MTIKIEVTGESIAEVADKLLAIGGSLSGGRVTTAPAPGSGNAAPDTAAKAKPKAVKEAPEKDAGEPVGGEKSIAKPAEEPEPSKTAATPTPATPAAASASEAAPLDFEKDVTPVVLRAVKEKGKPWVQDVLAQFGVERASQVPDSQFAELVGLINEALG